MPVVASYDIRVEHPIQSMLRFSALSDLEVINVDVSQMIRDLNIEITNLTKARDLLIVARTKSKKRTQNTGRRVKPSPLQLADDGKRADIIQRVKKRWSNEPTKTTRPTKAAKKA